MSETPYIAVGNKDLAGAPDIKAGDSIRCLNCGALHKTEVVGCVLLFYRCDRDGKSYLAGIDGKLVDPELEFKK